MWKFLFICGLAFKAVQGTIGYNCDVAKCSPFLSRLDPTNPSDLVPDRAKLIEYCPDIIKYVGCISKETETCTGRSLIELATSDNRTVAKISNVLMGSSNLLTDLCDENSTIHEAYVQSSDCLRRILNDPSIGSRCMIDANIFSELYMRSSESKEEIEKICLSAAYFMGCVVDETNKECGVAARETLIEIVKRSQVIKYGVCSPDNIMELKTTFIDFLERKGVSRSIFEQTFDLRRKK